MSSTVVYIVIGSVVILILAIIALISYGEHKDKIAEENRELLNGQFKEQFDRFMEPWNWEDDPKKQWKDTPCTVTKCDKRIQITLGDLFEGLKPMLDKYALETVSHPYSFMLATGLFFDCQKTEADGSVRPNDRFRSACAAYINAKRDKNKTQYEKLVSSLYTRKK